MKTRVLLPTDFSGNSWNAIHYGLSLYKEVECEINLLHVTPIDIFALSDVPLASAIQVMDNKILVDQSMQKLKKALLQIEEQHPNTKHNFSLVSAFGLLLEEVKKLVAQKSIDMIIMGTKGASGLKEIIVGSNTAEVITKIKCPVLVIPEEATFKTPGEIVFPTDFHISYTLNSLEPMFKIADMYGAAINVLYIDRRETKELDEEQKKNKALIEGYLKGKKHHFYTLTNKKLEAALQCFVESREIDMIAMVAKNLNFFQQMFFKPTVAEISYHTQIPLLVLHE